MQFFLFHAHQNADFKSLQNNDFPALGLKVSKRIIAIK